MPQPGHVTALQPADEGALPEDLRPYFQKCRDKLGFVPNVLRAWLLRPEKLRNFIRLYDELMLAPSGLTKLERAGAHDTHSDEPTSPLRSMT